MNCKQGDLAMVKSGPSAGNIVTCVSRYDGPWLDGTYAPGWTVDRPLIHVCGRKLRQFADAGLRPIRDNDADDETLTWAGRPQETPTDVIASEAA